ncbi:MAG: ribonuclease P [Methanosarcinales archaeon]|nr:ribonuclease P [Methanosarcinales archaeon]
MRRKNKKEWIREMAHKRIRLLFKLAEESFEKAPRLSNRYVQLAKKISMRHRIRMPRALKRRICKECGTFLVPGSNCRIRIRNDRILTTCLECGMIMRIPF